MQRVNVTFESMPSAIGLLLDRTERLENIINKLTEPKKEDIILHNGRRIVEAKTVSKKYNIPMPTIYGKVHRKEINPLKMPGSRKLYFDLDDIEASFTPAGNA